MKIILLGAVLLLGACDGPSAPPPDIIQPQREALEKAKGVEQTLQQSSDAMRKRDDGAQEE